MKIDGTYIIKGRGLVVTGIPEVGDELCLGCQIIIEGRVTGVESSDVRSEVGLIIRAEQILAVVEQE